jgi:Ni,Fe-hydrogenase III large subunit
MNSNRVVTGIFEGNKFYHTGKSIIAEKDKSTFQDHLQDCEIPLWLLRYNYGKTWDEDYSLIPEENYISFERQDQIKYIYDEKKGLRGLDYTKLNIPLTHLDYSHAVGPIHAGVIEPGHFRFSIRGEIIRHLTIRLGFQKRNILNNCHGKSVFEISNYLASSTIDTTSANSLAISRAIENKYPSEISQSEELYRLLLLESERVAIYVGDLGGIVGDVGFYPLLGVCSTERGFPLGWMELLTGSRFARFAIHPFQSRYNSKASVKEIQEYSQKFKPWLKKLSGHVERAIASSTLRERMQNVGTISSEESWKYGFTGHTARSSSSNIDIRRSDPLYEDLVIDFFHIDQKNKLIGDSWARFLLRWNDIQKSVSFIQKATEAIDWNQIQQNWKPYNLSNRKFNSEIVTFGTAESWRGAVLVAFKWNKSGNIERIYYRDPSVLNWHALELAARGMLIGDFPLMNKSMNHSYAGVDL